MESYAPAAVATRYDEPAVRYEATVLVAGMSECRDHTLAPVFR